MEAERERVTDSAISPHLQECDCKVLSQVLHQLRQLLQDRGLTLSSLPDLSPLCQLLCQLVDDKSSRLQKLRSVWSGSTPSTSSSASASSGNKLDLSSSVFPALTTLITYPSHLDRGAQVRACSLEHVHMYMCTFLPVHVMPVKNTSVLRPPLFRLCPYSVHYFFI